MLEEYENKRKKQVTQMKSIMDYGMGSLILLAGVFFLFHNELNIPFGAGDSSAMEKIFGGMCMVYGAWRIYRGYKKNYFG